jgi:F0F1-type ATP synthase delta subunit
MHDLYVTAVLKSIKAGQKPAVVFDGLKHILARRGHERLLPRIVRSLEREAARATHSDTPILTVVKASDKDTALVAALMKDMGVTSEAAVVVDETIIGGAKLRSGDTEIDATYKTALINLYHTITK